MSAITDRDQCTYDTCPIEEYGYLTYRPSLPGNAIFLAIFSAVLIAQIPLGLRYKTWTFLIGMIGGAALEIIGYVGRILLYQNIFIQDNFVVYLVGLTIGPAFFSAAIYLCLARIIRIYGESLSYFKPSTITVFFICWDVVALVLQAAGGAIVSITDDQSLFDTGLDIMIAGLGSQVATTTVFVFLCLQIAYSIRRKPHLVNTESETLRNSRRFKLFLLAIAVATVTILVRCIFRVAELNDGFHSQLANDEPAFMILDSAMMVIAALALTLNHPGPIVGPWWDQPKEKDTSASTTGGDHDNRNGGGEKPNQEPSTTGSSKAASFVDVNLGASGRV